MARLTPEEHESYMRTIMGFYENPDDGAGGWQQPDACRG